MTIRKIIPIAFIILLLSVSGVVKAQNDDQTPSPTPDVPAFLYDWEVQNFYPAAMRFNIVIDRTVEEIQQLVLIIQLNEAITLPIVPEQAAVFSDEFTEISYLWEIPLEDVPPFYSLINYSWLVTTQLDGTAGISSSFLFRDPTQEWIEDRDDISGLNILKTENDVSPEDIRETMSPILTLLTENTGEARQIDVLLVEEDFQFTSCETNEDDDLVIIDTRFEVEIPCSQDIVEESLARSTYELFQLDYTDLRELQSVLTDYAVSQFYPELWQNVVVPTWFRNGLRDFYNVDVSARDLVTLQSAARNGNLITLNQIDNSSDLLRDVQERAMVLYIADQIGVDRLFEFANEASSTDNFARLYEETVDAPLSAIVSSIETWLFENSTEADFFYVPYLSTTATPTATISNTPFPPTATVTSTATNTPTVTPSVTGVLSATPLPTLTNTLTPLPRRPTVTPRPAGSSIDPTAVPVQTSSSDDNQQISPELLLLGSGIFIILALIIFVFTRRGSR